MNKSVHKCSSIEHKEIDAIKYCKECNIYLCNNCAKFHSDIFIYHHPYSLDKAQNIFTELCKIENHSGKLECCAFCITKIKKEGIGQHTDCNICTIEDIFEEKKKNFENNIKSLEDLSGVLSSKELNEIIENIEKNKEKVKLDIEKTFMKYEMN